MDIPMLRDGAWWRTLGEQPNLLGYSDTGIEPGGQYYYDLALAVDPANANIVHACGIQRWVSTDGGVTFTCPAKWSHSYKPNYLHADIHDIRYFGGEIWVASDGAPPECLSERKR
jgi:hypothetical protein